MVDSWGRGAGGAVVAGRHPGPLPAAVATRLAEGRDPVSLLRAHSPEPDAVAARLAALGLRFLVPGDKG